MSVNLEIDLAVYGGLGALLILAGWLAVRFTGILAPEPQHAGAGDAGLDSLGKNGGDRAGLAGRGRAMSPPSPAARRDGMGAQGEPATGWILPRANTIPPRTLRGKIVPRPGEHTRSSRDTPMTPGPGHRKLGGPDLSDWLSPEDAAYDADRCSDPPEVSCSDAGCPVHGDYDDGWHSPWDADALDALMTSRPPEPPGTDLVLAGAVVPWGDATLRTMLAMRARDKNIEWGEGLKRTEAVLARAREILPEATGA